MAEEKELIPHLFRTEYGKIVAVLGKLFGFEHIEIAEDMVSDTFMLATETWGINGLPDNPAAWLYTVAKNKAKDQLKRHTLFSNKIAPNIQQQQPGLYEIEIDLSGQNIVDSQLQMMFAVCHPCIPPEAQIALSLRILCGFGIEEIADAFLTNKDTINKRLYRAKEKLREKQVKIELPKPTDIASRLQNVLTTLYLLFNEGYHSASKNKTLQKELCLEAMRLTFMLTQNPGTDKPEANALLALMCFHASRFEARTNSEGELVLYEDQDVSLWDKELVEKGQYFLNRASTGNQLTKYHLEAGIAYWHTKKTDTPEKWESILQLYNHLLIIEYSPITALNRTYALAKAVDKQTAIIEAEKLQLTSSHLYFSLLANLYQGIDNIKAVKHLNSALEVCKSASDKNLIQKQISALTKKVQF